MVSFREYVDAIRNNDEDNLIYSYQEGAVEEFGRAYIDKNQSGIITYRDGSLPIGQVYVYKHKMFDERETRIVISCATHDATININDIGNGGIVVKDSAIDSEKPLTNLRLGFTDEKFYVSKKVEPIVDESKHDEEFDEYEHDKKRTVQDYYIYAEDWSVDKILEEIHYAVINAWSSDYVGKTWEQSAEILFDAIKPALVLAINDCKEKWIEYLKHWIDNYRKMILDKSISKDKKEKYLAICNLYEDTINTLQNTSRKGKER